MCTIITADQTINRLKLVDRIKSDSINNPDGFALLMIMETGEPLFLKSMNVDAICELIMAFDYERVFIHTRYATQGDVNLQNVHGWNTGHHYVFHNGSIRSKIAQSLDVDSMAIVHWLREFGLDVTLDFLKNEHFANVFLVDLENRSYIVHRSSSGSLFTDKNGNYSTNQFDQIVHPVSTDYFDEHYMIQDSMFYDDWSDLDAPWSRFAKRQWS